MERRYGITLTGEILEAAQAVEVFSQGLSIVGDIASLQIVYQELAPVITFFISKRTWSYNILQ